MKAFNEIALGSPSNKLLQEALLCRYRKGMNLKIFLCDKEVLKGTEIYFLYTIHLLFT